MSIGAKLVIACMALIASACSAGRDDASRREITFQTPDGYTIHATLYLVEAGSAPGLILVPMLGATRDTFDRFALRAQGQGFMSVAIDVRGHGGSISRNGAVSTYRTFTAKDWAGASADIEGAKQALLAAGADADNLAIVGASIGANLALRYSADDEQIQAVVMMSPGLNYQGVATESSIARLGKRPVLLVTGADDAYSADTCRALKPLAQGHCEIREYEGGSHGTDLLDVHPMSADQILLWLSEIIGK